MPRRIRGSGTAYVQANFTALPSSHRLVIVPLVHYILELYEKYPGRHIVVITPELVEVRRYEYFFHNQRGRVLD